MHSDTEAGHHLPTLVQHCQRVACINVENICSLGEGWRYDLIRPVLESCTPETLLRFEEADPYISNYTEDIWKELFVKENPAEAHQYDIKVKEEYAHEPESWRDELFDLRDRRRQRLDQLTEKLKASRQEEEERRRESAIKITDRLPPPKRARHWSTLPPRKTLFQKTKSETAKLQKGVFGTRYSRPTFQTQRIVPHTASAKLPPPPTPSSANSGSRVVVRRVPDTPPSTKVPPVAPSKATVATRPSASANITATPIRRAPSPAPPSSPPPPQQSSPLAVHSPPPRALAKKKPATSLFMPKHRAYSQLPPGAKS